MTLDLTAIEAREKAATKGPWYWMKILTDPAQPKALITRDPSAPPIIATPCLPVCEHPKVGDAEFIAHARIDIPNLIAEVRRLQATEDALEHVEWSGTPDSLGNGTCPYCGASTLDAGDGPPRQHKERCVVSEALHPGRQSW